MVACPTLVLVLATLAAGEAPVDPSGAEFFEKEVRPILVGRCLECHGPEKTKGGLRLDSRAGALAGGLGGPAVVPGEPAESPLIEAINYGDVAQMPPRSKLPATEIDTLTRWVARGAPWPATDSVGPAASNAKTFDLRERARFWSFQPVRAVEPPDVARADWPRTSVDRFLLARLEAAGVAPAPEVEKRALIRRATFDLTGLPPTPGEVDAFVVDDAPDAFAKVVDRLLASPHYGERWARHWLDLVRYAETSGHEFDYDIPGAYRYRDYAIRAFNADVPFDQFVVEHVAGDLLEHPRRNPADGLNESICGTGFFALGDGTHSPVDVREEEMRRIENQVDVLSKTFLGLTVACARCHDHKFDAISTKDYYALAGYFRSSRFQLAPLDPPGLTDAPLAELAAIRADLPRPDAPGSSIGAYLLATVDGAAPDPKLDPATLARWVQAVRDPAARQPGHPLHAWTTFNGPRPTPAPDDSERFEDFDDPGFAGWTSSGPAFGSAPSAAGAIRVRGEGDGPACQVVPPGWAHSGLASDRLSGVLRSPSFTIGRKFIHYRAAGRKARIRLVIDGFQKIRGPIYDGMTIVVDQGDAPRWYAQDVGMWLGERAYIELVDGGAVDYTTGRGIILPGGGYLAVDSIRFSDRAEPPPPTGRFAAEVLEGAESVEALARRYEDVLGRADDAESVEALAFFVDRGLVRTAEVPATTLARYRAIEATLPAPAFAPALIDGPGEDERVHIRGGHKTLGEVVPRRFLEAIGGVDRSTPASGSGRMELARRMVDPGNPMVARVAVNRIWKHHFGEGLVRSVDDFGAMGREPTHPELLDWLAARFVAEGWSFKRMHRLLMLSSAYRMAGRPEPTADAADPENKLLHRMNPRRLEAEAVRDAILAASGRLDRTSFGPSVAPHLTPFMDGRGRPSASGPLDGDGRRSLYLNVRRNFLNPMLMAFDFPAPASTMGRRNTSNVPAQSLALWNDPFVIEQAKLWAGRSEGSGDGSPPARVDGLFRTAFGRPPTEAERAESLAFVEGGDASAWADLCQVFFNAKEFIYVE